MTKKNPAALTHPQPKDKKRHNFKAIWKNRRRQQQQTTGGDNKKQKQKRGKRNRPGRGQRKRGRGQDGGRKPSQRNGS